MNEIKVLKLIFLKSGTRVSSKLLPKFDIKEIAIAMEEIDVKYDFTLINRNLEDMVRFLNSKMIWTVVWGEILAESDIFYVEGDTLLPIKKL